MIDVSKWGKFRIGDLFEVLKGSRLTKADKKDGNINFVSTSIFNNGVINKIGNNEHIHPANTIVVVYDGHATGRAYYQDEPYWASDSVNVLYPKFTLTRNIAMYLITIFETVGKEFVYTNKWTQEKMIQTFLSLPITSSGEPDWDYMESYMKVVMDESEKNIANLKKIDDTKQSIDVNGWGEFRIGDLLNMEKQIELSPIDAFNNNTQNEIMYPFYGQSSVNNGIIDYYYLGEDLLNNINSEHCIMIHSNTHLAYYVNTPFYLKDGHGATTIFTNEHLTESSTFFIITVLNKAMFDKFDYDTKATKENLENLIIKLPIASSGEPDWDYMEFYMKAIMEETENNLAILKTL